MGKRLAHAHPEELVAQEKRGNAATVSLPLRAGLWTFFELQGFDEQEDTSGGGG